MSAKLGLPVAPKEILLIDSACGLIMSSSMDIPVGGAVAQRVES